MVENSLSAICRVEMKQQLNPNSLYLWLFAYEAIRDMS
jgi:hypothetical protein